jgi:histone deacetylase 8
VDGLAGDPCAVWNWGLGSRGLDSEENERGGSEGEPVMGSLGWYVTQILKWPGKKIFLGGGMTTFCQNVLYKPGAENHAEFRRI